MPKQYTLLTSARSDLQYIIRYIADDNPTAARKMKAAIMDACTKLGENPDMGQARDDLTTKPLRFWPVHRSYMIVYDSKTSPVQIMRIYNSARDITAILPQ